MKEERLKRQHEEEMKQLNEKLLIMQRKHEQREEIIE